MKNKETLEEAATKEGLYRASKNNFNQAEAGYNAKWFKRGAIFGAKWQQERSYSEEDIKLAFIEGHNICRCVTDNTDEAKECFNLWFQQFKKK